MYEKHLCICICICICICVGVGVGVGVCISYERLYLNCCLNTYNHKFKVRLTALRLIRMLQDRRLRMLCIVKNAMILSLQD